MATAPIYGGTIYNPVLAPETENLFGKNAYMFSFAGAVFVQKDHYLWTLQSVYWRQSGKYDWQQASAGEVLTLSNSPIRILVSANRAIEVTKRGWEETPFLSIDTMIAKIVEVVDYVELDSGNVYALLPDSRKYLGCEELLCRLTSEKMVEPIHVDKDRALWRLVKENINPDAFLKFEKEVTGAYKRIVGQ